MTKTKVAILRTTPETVIEDYQKLCRLAGIDKALDPSATTILKDNITWHNVFPGVNTTPWQLEGTILALRNAGFTNLTAVHNHTVVTIPEKGEEDLKFKPIYEKFNIPVLFNFKPEDMKWVEYTPKFKTLALHKIFPQGIYIPDYFVGKNIVHLPTVKSHSYTTYTGALKNAFGGLLNYRRHYTHSWIHETLALHKIFPQGIHIPDYFVGKNIVHLPTVKSHSYTTYTGALKNAFGGLLNYRRHYTHSWIHETLVDLLAIGKEIHPGMFATMDGTTAGSGPGPRTVVPHDKHIILAARDQVAIDTVAARLMGFDWRKLPCIALSHEHGLGTGDPAEIEIVGDTDAANQNWNFKVGVNLATGAGRIFWHDTPLKYLQKVFFHTPLVNLFIYASELYHDKIWYNTKGRKIVEKWEKESPWGKLFVTYKK